MKMMDNYEIIYARKENMPGDIKVAAKQDQPLQRIESLVRRRTETDRKMGYTWMIVPFLPLGVAIAIGATFVGILVSVLPRIGNLSQPTTAESAIAPIVGATLALFGVGVIVFFAVLFFGALSFYYLIDRQNRHFGRQQLLFSTIHLYLASKVPASENISQLGYLSQDSTYAEGARPAGLWALLFLFLSPIVALIASYSLTQDMRKHDDLQCKYQVALAPSLVEAGFQEPNFSTYKPYNRDPVLFIILTAITGGLFWIYWYYTLLRDYNEHFANQAKFEEQILKTLIPLPTQRTCGSCGGTVPRDARFCPSCGSQQTG
jgi:hypothetical protein